MQRKPDYGLSHADGDPLVTTGYLGKCVFIHQLVAKGNPSKLLWLPVVSTQAQTNIPLQNKSCTI